MNVRVTLNRVFIWIPNKEIASQFLIFFFGNYDTKKKIKFGTTSNALGLKNLENTFFNNFY